MKSDVHTLSTLDADDDNADEDENISIPPTHAIEESEDEENEDEQNRGRHPWAMLAIGRIFWMLRIAIPEQSLLYFGYFSYCHPWAVLAIGRKDI